MLIEIGVGFPNGWVKWMSNYLFVFLHFSRSKEVKDEHTSLTQCECL